MSASKNKACARTNTDKARTHTDKIVNCSTNGRFALRVGSCPVRVRPCARILIPLARLADSAIRVRSSHGAGIANGRRKTQIARRRGTPRRWRRARRRAIVLRRTRRARNPLVGPLKRVLRSHRGATRALPGRSPAPRLRQIVPEQRSTSVNTSASCVKRWRNERNAAWRWSSYVFTLMPTRCAISARFRPSKKVSRMI